MIYHPPTPLRPRAQVWWEALLLLFTFAQAFLLLLLPPRLSNSLGLVSFSALAPQHLAPSLLLASGLLVVAGVAFLLELAYKKSRRAMDAENVALEMGDKA